MAFALTLSLSPPAWWALLGLVPLGGWLIGGIPWGVLWVRWLKGIDLRSVGSGNTGATNAARAMGGGKKGLALFLLVYLLDLGKALAVLLPLESLPSPPPGLEWAPEALFFLGGLSVILGHCYSPWLHFQGGKGVATTCGVLLVLDWRILLLGLALFFLVLLLSRMVSLGSMAMGLSLPALGLLLPGRGALGGEFFLLLVLGLLILYRHRSNLGRILRGEERKVSFPWSGKKGTGKEALR
ncbi:MAG TPA: glycerol-3-phosphate 1-O-acyltransferase [Planctomycetes bacterium]|nr:glycerol-3-phosphate 1-O-acyltransferase [Planctomycetota bacterium]